MSTIALALAVANIKCRKSTGEEMVHCPSATHEDKKKSCSVNHDKDVFKCFSCEVGGGIKECLRVSGMSESQAADWMRENSGVRANKAKAAAKTPKTRLPASGPYWEYKNADGSPHMRVYRHSTDGGKVYSQWERNDDSPTGWFGRQPPKLILYGLPRLVSSDKAKNIYVVEGEKCAQALNLIGAVATCWPGGSGSRFSNLDLSPLHGRNVVLWPDNDKPGKKAMVRLAHALAGKANVRIVDVPDTKPEKWDAADAIAGGWGGAELGEFLKPRLMPPPPPPEKDKDAEIMDAFAGWVYTLNGEYVHLDDPSRALKQGVFEQLMLHVTNPLSPHRYVAMRNGLLPVVSHQEYLPQKPPGVISARGMMLVNTYEHKKVPKAVERLGEKDKDALKAINQLFSMLCRGDDADTLFLTAYIAANIQQPGRKIMVAPIICGPEGYGKTTLGRILSVCMGERNVGQVTSASIQSAFTSWATGHAVKILEEIGLYGPQSHATFDRIKTFITNKEIEVVAKGRDPVNMQNTANYIAFTNKLDALPITKTNRRWWVIFTPEGNYEEGVPAFVGDVKNAKEFFDKVYDCLNNRPKALRRYFLDIDAAWIFNLRRTKETAAARQMIEERLEGINGYNEVRDLIAQDKYYANEAVVHSKALFHAVENTYDVHVSPRMKGRILEEMGYNRRGLGRIDGQQGTVWVKDPAWTFDDAMLEITRRKDAGELDENPFTEGRQASA